jgi:hypothetical protein
MILSLLSATCDEGVLFDGYDRVRYALGIHEIERVDHSFTQSNHS